ncbi:MAG: hypothetical protein ACP5E3_09155 [Bacteroidales bacterium]
MKRILLTLFAGLLLLASCNKEPAIEPSANFNTKLVDNTAYAGETFYMYLDNCTGDFLTLFQGLTASTTYDPDNPAAKGSPVDINSDSIALTYRNAGEYQLTLVAASSGNWAEDYEMDVKTVMVNVVDTRTGIVSMEVGDRVGVITAENEILFYAHKLEDIDNERVKFITASADAKVYVDGELQETGRNRHDFSAINPGDDEGRPVVYTVEALSGETEEYTAKFILRDPSSEKILYGLSSSNLTATFEIDEDNKEVTVSYYTGDALSGRLLADASTGALVKVGNTEIQEREGNVNLETATEILVIAEDESEQAYSILLYEKEKITAFNFTAYDDGSGLQNISPVLIGDVDFEARTIDLQVPQSLILENVVASFEGITDFTLKVEGTTLTSGTTQFDYSLDEETTSKDFTVEVLDGSTLVDTYTLKVHY